MTTLFCAIGSSGCAPSPITFEVNFICSGESFKSCFFTCSLHDEVPILLPFHPLPHYLELTVLYYCKVLETTVHRRCGRVVALLLTRATDCDWLHVFAFYFAPRTQYEADDRLYGRLCAGLRGRPVRAPRLGSSAHVTQTAPISVRETTHCGRLAYNHGKWRKKNDTHMFAKWAIFDVELNTIVKILPSNTT